MQSAAENKRSTRNSTPISRLTGCSGHFFADHHELIVAHSFFVEPVGTGDLFECIDRGLNSLGPGDGDELNVSVRVSEESKHEWTV